MDRRLVPLRVAGDPDVAGATQALRAALDGSGPALQPTGGPGGHGGPAPDASRTVPDAVALAVPTSGSTGRPRVVLLDADALRASAAATHRRLGGPGRWVLALPLAHVAGLQVVVRSLLAGHDPVVPAGSDPAALAAAVAAAAHPGGPPLYASLVPTQLYRVLEAADGDTLPGSLQALRRLDALLVGGSAVAPGLLARARAAGLRVVTTYGMTETCGGCVYDGTPLAGVRVRAGVDGLEVAGPVLARGYLDRPDLDAAAFTVREGVRWFRTRDVGELRDGSVRVLGRSDDVLVTGGAKVAPAAVEAVLCGMAGVGQVCVVGVPDAEWGQAVTAVVVPAADHPAPSLEQVRAHVRRTLGTAAAPRHLLLTDALPERGPGKVDRAEVTRRAAAVHR